MTDSRRDFIKKTMAASAAVSLGGMLPGFSAKSYGSIIGANDRIKVGVMGVHSRGLALARNYASQKNCEVISISDVDSNSMNKCVAIVEKIQNSRPKAIGDFRKALENKDLEAMVIATPDHWHAPAAILACKAGKHVYVEKPCSHNPQEGEMLVAAARKYNRKVQMGSQRRSWPNVIEAIGALHDGIIGRVYFAKGWYTNNRASIGIGQKVDVPSWLNYDLWQGPAPREAYRNNILPYNWHWFWNWGTGEAGNNGTHFTDLMRWGLGVDYPSSVRSGGGRYRYKDDWQTPDTQVMTFEFPNDTFMEWEGRSCNGRYIEGSSVGAAFYGETGTLVLDGRNSYKLYDLKNKLLKEVKNNITIDTRNTVSPAQALDALHIQNFFDGIRKNASLNAEIEKGFKSTLLVQLGNIAVRAGNISFKTDPKNGHILHNDEAGSYWTRKYQPGWEPTV
ncbi:MAG TPA: Gfo/Idh/MocA family oxidoreductase [Chitinophagaceae bacterium]|nr:Gfo/Idh/MocA family oxidoreductase [Chitinophagaceae bacterium]